MSGLRPSVGVVIPCFRQAHLLGNAICSVVAQSYAASEIIVVDDGSDEEVAEALKPFPSVQLIRQQHGGACAARNAGLRAAKSEKLVFLDADDRLMPDGIRAGLDCFTANPDAAFVYGAYEELSDGQRTHRFTPMTTHAELVRCNWIAMIGAVVFDRQKLLDVGCFDVTLDMCEDWDTYLRLARRHPFACHDRTVALYVRHAGGRSRNVRRLKQGVATVRERERQRGLDGDALAAWREGEAVWTSFYPEPRSIVARIARKLGGG